MRRRPVRAVVASMRGLTLVEVLLALTLALVLLGTVFVFVQDLIRARERMESAARRERAVDAFIDALEQAISTCVLESAEGAFSGTPAACAIRSASTDPMRLFAADGTPFPATVGASFGFEASDGSLRVRRGASPEESLPAKVFALRLRYHDGLEWVDSFDAAERRRLPAAIEVCVWMTPWPDAARPSWLPDPVATDATVPGDPLNRGVPAYFLSRSPTQDGAPLRGSGETPDLARRWPAEALDSIPAPDRRRVIVVPDAEPPVLMPGPRGRAS